MLCLQFCLVLHNSKVETCISLESADQSVLRVQQDKPNDQQSKGHNLFSVGSEFFLEAVSASNL